jgi:serine/threonine protein kinase
MPADCFFFQNKSSNQDIDTTPSHTKTPKIVVNTASFDSMYEIGPKLGTGAFAAVYKCTQKNDSKRPAAVKVFDLSKVPKEKQAGIRKGIHEVRRRRGKEKEMTKDKREGGKQRGEKGIGEKVACSF